MPRRLFLTPVVALLLAAGCQSKPAPVPTPPGAAAQVDPVTLEPGSPEAVAQRTALYAKRIEEILAKRQHADLDPAAMRLSLGPAQTPTASGQTPAGRPTIPDTTPAANGAVTLLGPMKDPSPPPAGFAPPRPPAPAVVRPAPDNDLERTLTRTIKDYPRDVVANLDYQMLQVIRDESSPQLSTFSAMSPEDRELVSAIADCLAIFRTNLRTDPNMLSAKKVRPIFELADRLRAQADLRIPTVSLCTKVEGFGKYDPIDPPRFTAGKAHPALVYCEVENFASQLNDQHLWETRLTQETVLFTETGMPVWQDKSKPIVDTARNRRHDFYLVKRIDLPDTLTINRYILKVSIFDQSANRVAESSIPITIVAN